MALPVFQYSYTLPGTTTAVPSQATEQTGASSASAEQSSPRHKTSSKTPVRNKFESPAVWVHEHHFLVNSHNRGLAVELGGPNRSRKRRSYTSTAGPAMNSRRGLSVQPPIPLNKPWILHYVFQTTMTTVSGTGRMPATPPSPPPFPTPPSTSPPRRQGWG